jgi:hypothetical protein
MNLTVREVDPHREREGLVRILKSCLGPDTDELRFDWLYFANPHGSARVWVLEANKELIGAGAAIPRRILMSGISTPGCIFGDFCISPNYRSIGPALQLQRACMQAVESGWARIAYDFPSTSMMAVYKRLRVQSSVQLVRMAKPLRVDRQIQEKMKTGVLSKSLGGMGNALLKIQDRTRPGRHKVETARLEESFGEEFEELFKRAIPKSQSWRVERSVAYLNWRFCNHPKIDYAIWTARCGGRLEGFAVTEKRGPDVWIAEMLVSDAPGILEGMILFLSENAREEEAIALNLPFLPEHQWIERLRGLGFRARESSPVIVYAAQSEATSPSWLTHGDRDS